MDSGARLMNILPTRPLGTTGPRLHNRNRPTASGTPPEPLRAQRTARRGLTSSAFDPRRSNKRQAQATLGARRRSIRPLALCQHVDTVRLVETFTASDLSRRRRELLDAAVHDGAMVRTTGGVLLRIERADRVEGLERLAGLSVLLSGAVAACEGESPSPAALGELAWLTDWGLERRKRFVVDLADTVALSVSIGSTAPTDALLAASRPPAPDERFDGPRVWERLDDKERHLLTEGRRHLHPRRRQ